VPTVGEAGTVEALLDGSCTAIASATMPAQGHLSACSYQSD